MVGWLVIGVGGGGGGSSLFGGVKEITDISTRINTHIISRCTADVSL